MSIVTNTAGEAANCGHSETSCPITLVGIDPGKSGGIAIIAPGEDAIAYRMPETEEGVWRLLAGCDPGVCILERVHSSPQQGVRSAFTFGRSAGALKMAAVAAGLRVVEVTPMRWQREFGLLAKGRRLGQGDTEKKNANKAEAKRLFPHLRITHATADALLLCEYGRRAEALPASS